MSSNAIDAPSGGALSGAQIGFAAGTSAPSNGMIISGAVGIGTLSPSYPPYLLDVSNTGINAAIRAISTTTGSANEGALFLARGDQANGYAQTHYLTGTTQYWTTGLRAPDNNYHIYDTGNSVDRVVVTTGGSLVMNTAALATNATDGFIYESGCAGTPTGVPTSQTGRSPIVVDTTNNVPYFYNTVKANGSTSAAWVGGNGKVLIEKNIVTGSVAASITFNNIPQVFDHLELILICRSNAAVVRTEAHMTFNNDTGTNYEYNYVFANYQTVSGGGAASVASTYLFDIAGASSNATFGSSGSTSIPIYTQTNFYKSYTTTGGIAPSNTANSGVGVSQGSWQNTAAITRIDLFPLTGSFVVGTTAYLYGIR